MREEDGVSDKKKKETVRKDKSSKLGKSETREVKEQLTHRRQQLRKDVENMDRDALSKGGTQGSGELSTMPLHMADVGSDTFEQDMTLGRLESGSEELSSIESALERIERGTYGLCENCRKPIPKTRLRAIPYAKLCVECKEKEEAVS